MVIAGVDHDPANKQKVTTWASEYGKALHPHSSGASYVNFMMEEGSERVRACYGENYERLRRASKRNTTRRTSFTSTRTSSPLSSSWLPIFDEIFFVDLPNQEEPQDILSKHLSSPHSPRPRGSASSAFFAGPWIRLTPSRSSI